MSKKIVVSFDPGWILSRKDDDSMPVDAFIAKLKQVMNVQILQDSVMDCELVLCNDELSNDEIESKVKAVIMQTFVVVDLQNVAQITVSDYEEPIPEVDLDMDSDFFSLDDDENDAEDNGEQERLNLIAAAHNDINNLVGADEFKALADECMKVAPGLVKHNTLEAFTHRALLVSINDGNGLSTYLQMYAKLIGALGLFNFSSSKTRVLNIKI